MIKRALISEIPRLLSYFPALGLVGPRQVGKTTLVKSLSEQFTKSILYLDLENLNDYTLLENDPQWFLEQHADKIVVIDEVQRMLSLFPLLRSLIDQNPEGGRFILLGSASPALLAQSSETLAGRIVYRELTPIRRDEAQVAQIDFESHWFRGGFPKALLAPDETLWYDWQEAFMKTYVESDLRLLGLKASPIVLQKLLRMLTTVQGSTLNYANLGNSMGISGNTLQGYIDYLEHSFVIRRLAPYFVNVGKRLVKSPKLYFRDSGMLHYLVNLTDYDSLISNVIAGHSWEGYVIEQIIGRLSGNIQPYYYRTQNGAEIDLCLLRGNEMIASFEIKLSNNPSSSKGNTEAIQDLGTEHNFIVTPSSKSYRANAHWQVCSLDDLWEYLKPLKLLKE
ncbi:ATP-binding protein [Arcicella sp. LKC2W]|uniref:ATP-binding protein n=1 Tax=Arcicella sp. LKC2W TaxID=2984198 RepID=UPI002B1EA8C2|nr:ATP-binding protein [Arcicella sp. LKC2W]MEA5461781.1 ATP-binding protein [Arcicella sp. LKC2W]